MDIRRLPNIENDFFNIEKINKPVYTKNTCGIEKKDFHGINKNNYDIMYNSCKINIRLVDYELKI